MLIGGLAVVAQGYERLTRDLDVCYERGRENVRRLVGVLRDLHAVPRNWPEGVPFILDEQTIVNGDTFTFVTDFGDVDVMATPSGTGGFADLASSADTYELDDGLVIQVASVDDLMRMKRASARAKDLVDVEALEAIAEERATSR